MKSSGSSIIPFDIEKILLKELPKDSKSHTDWLNYLDKMESEIRKLDLKEEANQILHNLYDGACLFLSESWSVEAYLIMTFRKAVLKLEDNVECGVNEICICTLNAKTNPRLLIAVAFHYAKHGQLLRAKKLLNRSKKSVESTGLDLLVEAEKLLENDGDLTHLMGPFAYDPPYKKPLQPESSFNVSEFSTSAFMPPVHSSKTPITTTKKGVRFLSTTEIFNYENSIGSIHYSNSDFRPTTPPQNSRVSRRSSIPNNWKFAVKAPPKIIDSSFNNFNTSMPQPTTKPVAVEASDSSMSIIGPENDTPNFSFSAHPYTATVRLPSQTLQEGDLPRMHSTNSTPLPSSTSSHNGQSVLKDKTNYAGHGAPLKIDCLSIKETDLSGGDTLIILGANLGKECRVVFHQYHPSFPPPSDFSHAYIEDHRMLWEQEAVIDHVHTYEVHVVCQIPAYSGPSKYDNAPIVVSVCVRSGTNWSNRLPFTYRPLSPSISNSVTPHCGPPSIFCPQPYCEQAHDGFVHVNQVPYWIIDEIGKGGSSVVYSVVDPDRHTWAIKIVNLCGAADDLTASYTNEITMLRSLKNTDRIIRLHDFEKTPKVLYLVLELASVDLKDVLMRMMDVPPNATNDAGTTQHTIGRIPSLTVTFYWDQMLRCVKSLHDQRIVHLDLKPQNFVLVDGLLKLIDLGVSQRLPDDATRLNPSIQLGTLSYMSPEQLEGPSLPRGHPSSPQQLDEILKVGRKSDIWSLGVLLYVMVHGRLPFAQHTASSRMLAIINPLVKIIFPPVENPGIDKALRRCLVRDFRERASVEELLAIHYGY